MTPEELIAKAQKDLEEYELLCFENNIEKYFTTSDNPQDWIQD